MRNKSFRLPNLTQRTTVIGRTGSGKTVLGAWLLSEQRFDKQPFVIIDYKHDDLLNSVDRITDREIGFNEVPKKPGIYILHPRPTVDDDAIEQWLYNVWSEEKVGLYIDEAYMLPDKGALQGIYTQGRSKRIPVITLTQRPVLLSKFAFSEADFFAVFHLQDEDDVRTAKKRTGISGIADERLDDYWSRWQDVGQDYECILQPAPSPDEIQQKLHDKLKPVRQLI